MTLQEYWDDSHPGDPYSSQPWARPILRGHVLVEVQGAVFCPHRVGTDGNIFRLDVTLSCGRTLRLLLPKDYPCEQISSAQPRPRTRGYSDALFGFPPRDRSRAVTDADRLTLDLTQ